MRVDVNLLAKPNETIEEHTNKAIQVATILLRKFSSVINRFAVAMTDSFFVDNVSKGKQIKEFILEVIKFHDYGKVNPLLQKHMNGGYASKSERRHAIYSFLLWLQEQKSKNLNTDTFEVRTILAYASISGHHSHQKEIKKKINNENFYDLMYKYVPELQKWGQLTEQEVEELSETIEDLLLLSPDGKTDVALTFSKFVYAILIVSDAIASSEISEIEYETAVNHFFFKDIKDTDIHTKLLQSPIIQMVNHSPLQATDSFDVVRNINDIRTLLNKKAVAACNEEVDIYILEAPVGTAKTLSSLSLADEIATCNNKRKIISVFPLNSVQSQYKHTILHEIGVSEQYLNVINSETLFKIDVEGYNKTNEEEIQNLNITESNLWLFERNCFSNELIITSHVRFFNTLAAVSRKSSLGFLSLMDSVVIIDEFQNYPEKYWEGIWGDLLRISEIFGVKWIFTTGTFPVAKTQLLNSFGNRIQYILTDKENKALFSSPHVKNRCTLSLLSYDKYTSIDLLGEDILQDILHQEKQHGFRQFIVCLSFVRHTKHIYHKLNRNLQKLGYTCYFLCGRHSTAYKEELMRVIKKHNQNRQDKIVLVTTKTVECGMNFDFDYGYKEFDMFDSVEQLTGRVNRSGYREKGETSLFYLERRKQEKEKLYTSNELVLKELENKNFRALYEDMYEDNKMDVANRKKEIDALHTQFQFTKYQEFMTIIEDGDYCTDIYLVRTHEETLFCEEIQQTKPTVEYAEMVIQSMALRKRLESYRMTVTTKWLHQQTVSNLIAREVKGIVYFVLRDDDIFESIVETYHLNGITTYLERDPEQEDTYEFY